MFPDGSNFIRHFRTARDPNGNVLNEPRHKPRNPLGSVSDMIERNGLSKLLEVGQQATFPLEYRKPVMTSGELLLQPAANAGELGSIFTNQKRSARPEFIEQGRFSDPRRTDYQDVATLQIECPELFKFRISAGKRKSHIDEPERAPPAYWIRPEI
jgi:hypothetical protein